MNNSAYIKKKNLTRFTYDNTTFCGWRLCVSREGRTFVKYFSDKRYGDEFVALAAAEDTLEKILHILNVSVEKHGRITKESLARVERLIH